MKRPAIVVAALLVAAAPAAPTGSAAPTSATPCSWQFRLDTNGVTTLISTSR